MVIVPFPAYFARGYMDLRLVAGWELKLGNLLIPAKAVEI